MVSILFVCLLRNEFDQVDGGYNRYNKEIFRIENREGRKRERERWKEGSLPVRRALGCELGIVF